MQEVNQIDVHNQKCFVCGFENQFGLHVEFKFDGQNKVFGEFFPAEIHQSYPGVLHGGIITALLDGAMNRVLLFQGRPARTGRLSVRFKKEANVENALLVSGEIIRARKQYAQLRSKIRTKDNTVIAFGEGIFIFC
jgi:acyl-coenzyme A thioesterase PaaI-like protein